MKKWIAAAIGIAGILFLLGRKKVSYRIVYFKDGEEVLLKEVGSKTEAMEFVRENKDKYPGLTYYRKGYTLLKR